jgi:hypothetical protein
MRHVTSVRHPWAIVSVIAALAAATAAGTAAELTRRRADQITVLRPDTPFDPYYGLAEYAVSTDPV